MINIITAMNNPKLNDELKKEKNINLICKDIFYKEGILEILENNIEKINYIIIDYNLPGEIELNNLFNFIKIKDEKINIILTIKKENKINIENKNIIKIFYRNNINLNYLKNYNNSKNNNLIRNKKEIILFFGENQVGKIMTILNIAYFLKNKKYKILIIELNQENKNIYFLFNKKNKIKNFNFKKYKILNIKKLLNKKEKTILKKIKIKIDKNIDFISINFLINFNKLKNNYDYILIKINLNNKLKKYNKILENIFGYKKIIGKIKYNKNYEKLINTKFKNFENKNLDIENILKKILN